MQQSFDEDFQLAYQTCLRMLCRREYSQQELKYKLNNLSIDNSVIELCLAQLIQENYQSDERFTEMFCRTRTHQRYGKKKILYELQQKGISDELAHQYIDEHQQQMLDNAIYLIHRQARKNDVDTVLNSPIIKNKITRFLAGKGYDYDMIALAFESLSD